MKILHLVVDDKFIDSAIREFEVVAPGRHEFFILDARSPYRHLKSPAVESVSAAAFLARARQDDVGAVFLHSLPPDVLPLLTLLPAGPRVLWIGWGWDYYGLLADAFPGGLVMPQTARLLGGLRPRSADTDIASLTASELSLARPYAKPGHRARQALQRVDFFCPVIDVEHRLLRQLHPWFRAEYLPWNYGTLEDYEITGAKPAVGRDILVGNSATPTSNHLEAFEWVRQRIDLAGRRVVVPLSYGDSAYAGAVVQAGRTMFGDAFLPLTSYLAKDAYIELLASCGLVVLNHVRQQALGNIVISALLGARIALNRRSPLYPWLAALGVEVDDVERLDARPLPPAERQSNAEAVRRLLDPATQRRRTRRLVEVAG
jgi:hypothetical protein